MEAIRFDTPLVCHSLRETEELAERFYRFIGSDAIVALYGPLGAGKTSFVRGVAAAAGIDPEEVSSPSFTLVNEYMGGATPIYHFDLYRFNDPSEFQAIGGDEYLTRNGIALIEWAENGNSHIPESRYNIHIEILGETTRRFVFSKVGI